MIKDSAIHEQDVSAGGLYARNWAFIPDHLQRALGDVQILLAGTGLGSMIARALAQTGFRRFFLADGDTVERPNLNRQDFTGTQIGQNKAQAVADTLRSIHTGADIEVVPRYLRAEDMPSLVERSDLIVNTIDLDNPAFLALNRAAHAQRKYCLFPMNLGWGGSLLVFSPDGLSLDEYLRQGNAGGQPQELVTTLIARVVQSLPGGVPDELASVLHQFVERTPESWPFDPQLGIAAHLTASLCARAAVAIVAGQPIREAPNVIWVNASDAIAPATTYSEQSENVALDTATALHDSDKVKTSSDHVLQFPTHHRPLETFPFTRARVEARIQESQSSISRKLAPEYTAILRPGTGLSVITSAHVALTDEERLAISRYRLEQYVTAGFYDADLVEQQALREDPSMEMLGARDTHIFVANEAGIILSYLCLQSPSHWFQPLVSESPAQPAHEISRLHPVRRRTNADVALLPMMSDLIRSGFPVETEYGEIFARHRGIRDTPVDNVYEISRFVRNLRLPHRTAESVTDLAMVETIVAAQRFLTDPRRRNEIVIGCMAPPARRFLHGIGIRIAYAAKAPILGENRGGEAPNGSRIWASASNEPGRFWPFALSCIELRQDDSYYARLDVALSRDSAQTARREMNALRRSDSVLRSRFASYTEETQGIEWADTYA